MANLIFEYETNDIYWRKPTTENKTDNVNDYNNDTGYDSGGASSSW